MFLRMPIGERDYIDSEHENARNLILKKMTADIDEGSIALNAGFSLMHSWFTSSVNALARGTFYRAATTWAEWGVYGNVCFQC